MQRKKEKVIRITKIKKFLIYFFVLFSLLSAFEFYASEPRGYLNNAYIFGLIESNIFFISLDVIALFLIGLLFFKNRNFSLALAFVYSGSIVNILSRLFRGGVYDYISFSFIPTFNFADLFIVIGTSILLWKLILEECANKNSA